MADPLAIENLFSIKGWVAVVTDGGTGLGLITAQALTANGARVYITGRRVEVLKQAEIQHPGGGSIVALPMDVASKDSIRSGVSSGLSKEKFVILLVNNPEFRGSKKPCLWQNSDVSL